MGSGQTRPATAIQATQAGFVGGPPGPTAATFEGRGEADAEQVAHASSPVAHASHGSGRFHALKVEFRRRKNSGRFSNRQIFLDMVKTNRRPRPEATPPCTPQRNSSSMVLDVNAVELRASKKRAGMPSPRARHSLNKVLETGKRQAHRQCARIAKLLRETPVLDRLEAHAILKLASAMQRVHFADGDALFTEGHPLTSCLLLDTGKVTVSSAGMTTAELDAAFPAHPSAPRSDGGAASDLLERAGGCFLGRPVLLAAAGRAPAWTSAAGAITAGASARAAGPVEGWAFTVELFTSLFGPVAPVLEHATAQSSVGGHEEHRSAANETVTATPMSMRDFREEAFLGAGSFGRVTLARCTDEARREFGQFFAIKTLSKTLIAADDNGVRHVNHERDLLRTLDHPFVLHLLTSFADRDCLYLVTSYQPSVSMWKLLYSRDARLPTRQRSAIARFWAAGVAEALRYLHAGGVAYRDLKPENLLVDAQGYVTVIDLGFSKKLPCMVVVDGQALQQDRTFTLCGTVEYLAPEFLSDEHGHDCAVDLWAFGCLLFELVHGRTPFVRNATDRDAHAILKRICLMRWSSVKFPQPFEREADIPGSPDSGAACKNLVEKLLVCDTNRRLGNQERGVLDVLDHAYFAGIDWDALVAKRVAAPWRPNAALTQSPAENDHRALERDPEEFPPFTLPNDCFAGWDE